MAPWPSWVGVSIWLRQPSGTAARAGKQYNPGSCVGESSKRPMNERQYQLVRVIRKIPLFVDFSLEEIQLLLRAGQVVQFKADEQIYFYGAPSDEMLVLLRGKLAVLTESGEGLARIGPGTPTGEMGLFTGQPRSATIVSLQACTAMVLGRKEIGLLLATNKEMQIKVLHTWSRC